MRACRERAGLCLLEVLMALAVLALAFLPVARLLTASSITGQSAHRLLAAALHARALAETISQLDPHELPAVSRDGQRVLGEPELSGPAALPAVSATPRPAFLTRRSIVLRRLADGTLVARAQVEWNVVPGDPGTRQVLAMQATGDAVQESN